MHSSGIDMEDSGFSTALTDTKGQYVDKEDIVLASLGKKPELRRVYNFWTCK